jgi:hypothetical protein
MIKIFHLLLLGSLVLFSNTLFAQNQSGDKEMKYYDVEIIVFRNDKVPRSHELNLPTPSANVDVNALDLSSPKSIKQAKARGITALKPEELRLINKVQGIIKSSRYTLLLHTGWRQPGNDEKNSIPVWIKGGRVYSDGYSSIDQFQEMKNIAPANEFQDESLEQANPVPEKRLNAPKGLYELEGQITVTLSRYLHTHVELVLRKPATPVELLQQNAEPSMLDENQVIEGQLLLNYGLNEKRRMRSKKLHYLDSPQFGMLVLITPYVAAEPALQEESISDSASKTTTPVIENNPAEG